MLILWWISVEYQHLFATESTHSLRTWPAGFQRDLSSHPLGPAGSAGRVRRGSRRGFPGHEGPGGSVIVMRAEVRRCGRALTTSARGSPMARCGPTGRANKGRSRGSARTASTSGRSPPVTSQQGPRQPAPRRDRSALRRDRQLALRRDRPSGNGRTTGRPRGRQDGEQDAGRDVGHRPDEITGLTFTAAGEPLLGPAPGGGTALHVAGSGFRGGDRAPAVREVDDRAGVATAPNEQHGAPAMREQRGDQGIEARCRLAAGGRERRCEEGRRAVQSPQPQGRAVQGDDDRLAVALTEPGAPAVDPGHSDLNLPGRG